MTGPTGGTGNQQTKQGHRPRTNTPSILLSNEENAELFHIIGRQCSTLATGVVQVLLADPNSNAKQWSKRHCGVACFIKDTEKRSFFIRVYDICKRKSMIYEQELYNQFRYKQVTPFFHTYDMDECVAGLNFANETEANQFNSVIQDRIRQRQTRKQERKQANSVGGNQQHSDRLVNNHGTTAVGIASAGNNDGYNKGTIKAKKNKGKKKALTKEEIGMPTNFIHVQHVGWDADKQAFDMNQLGPGMRQFFAQAGISESQLQDANTASIIYDFIEKDRLKAIQSSDDDLDSSSNGEDDDDEEWDDN